MLDFTCQYTSKQGLCKFTANLKFSLNNKSMHPNQAQLSASDCIGLYKTLYSALSQNKRAIFKQSFPEIVADLKLLVEAKQYLKDIRLTHILYKSQDSYTKEIYQLIGQFYSDISYSRKSFSLQEKTVFNAITNGQVGSNVDANDFCTLYNPITRNKIKMETFKQGLLSFPYKKYIENVEATKEIISNIENSYSKAMGTISVFETLADEAGEDIVNWSQHKISRRLNFMAKGSYRYYDVHHYISELSESLIKKGIAVKTTEKKVSRGEVLAKEYGQRQMTQEELLTLYKRGKNPEVIQEMVWDNLMTVITSDLKCIKDQWRDKWSNVCEKQHGQILQRLISLYDGSIEKFTVIKEFSYRRLRNLDWQFLESNLKYLSKTFVYDFINGLQERKRNGGKVGEISDAMWDKFFEGESVLTLLNMDSMVTKKFVSRLSVEDKISILPRLMGEFIDAKDNSVHFILSSDRLWDGLKSVECDYSHLPSLYSDVPWESIKEEILNNKRVIENFRQSILENKDRDFARKALCEYPSLEGRVTLHKELFTYVESAEIFLTLDNLPSSDTVSAIFDTEDKILYYMEKVLKERKVLGNEIVHEYVRKKYGVKKFREVLLRNVSDMTLVMEHDLLSLMDKKTKFEVLKKADRIIGSDSRGSYSSRHSYGDAYLALFFKDFTREEILEVDKDLTSSWYALYLCHVMNDEEIIKCCEQQTDFIRYNIERIPLSYLLRYKDKEMFKKLVGDQRDRSNKYFAQSLETRFQETLKKKLDIPNSMRMILEAS